MVRNQIGCIRFSKIGHTGMIGIYLSVVAPIPAIDMHI